jgi:hypothetical protein
MVSAWEMSSNPIAEDLRNALVEGENIMTIEYDEKGKIFTDIVSKVAIPAIVQTTEQLIKGNVHVRRDERLKDELDRDKMFLAMTDASIIGADGQTLYESRFLAVRRAQIIWVMPENESEDFGEA